MKSKTPQAKSIPEETFALTWRVLGGPAFEREFVFHPTRKWRFDFAWPAVKIAVEIDGGVHDGANRGYHNRKGGFEKDAEKLNEAALLGWRCIRLTGPMIQPSMLGRIAEEVKRGRL